MILKERKSTSQVLNMLLWKYVALYNGNIINAKHPTKKVLICSEL